MSGNGRSAAEAAAAASMSGKPNSSGGGNGSSGNVTIATPVYSSPSENATVSAGVSVNYGQGVPSNPGAGVGFNYKW